MEKTWNKIKAIIPGFMVALIIALISKLLTTYVSALKSLGAAAIAIFIGMFVGNVFLHQKVFAPGYKYSESTLLSYSIVLLGATLNVPTLLQLGVGGFVYVILQMIVTIIGTIFIGKALGFGQNFTYLMATGNGVCGSSAIGAVAPVIDADDKEKGITITIVNVTGIVLMFLMPIIAHFVYRNAIMRTSALIGGNLQSVGQVVASSTMVNLAEGSHELEVVEKFSLIFKILRVILLVAVVLLFGHLKSKNNDEIIEEEIEAEKQGKVSVPWYVIGFFITCALYSLKIIPQPLSDFCKTFSSYLEIIALAAIGLRVNIKELVAQGKKVTLYALGVGTLQVISALILIGLLVKN